MRSTQSSLLVFLLGCSVSSGADEEERRRGLCYVAIERQAGNAIDVHCSTLIPVFMKQKGDLPTRARAWYHHRNRLCAAAADEVLQQTFCEERHPEDWAALWQRWGAARLSEQTGTAPSDEQLSMFLKELGLTGDPRAGVTLEVCNQDCRWWTAQTESFGSADELSLFYADTITMRGDMPARMVAWTETCQSESSLPLCGLGEAETTAAIDAAWESWTGEAVRRQHRIYGLSLDETMLADEVYRVRRHFQLWGLPWSDRSHPSIGDGHVWARRP